MENKEWIVVLSAAIGAVSALIGTIVASIVNWKTKKRETLLRIREKVFDKRIKAHDNVFELIALLRTTISTNELGPNNVLITYPVAMYNKESLISLQTFFFEKVNPNSHWHSNKLSIELNAIQDYLATVKIACENLKDEYYPNIGKLIRGDFLDFSHSLEKITMDFFNSEIYKLTLVQKNSFMNANFSERQNRFEKTYYFLNHDEIKKVLNNQNFLNL